MTSIATHPTVYPESSPLQSGPEKIAQSLMHRHFATVCSTITWFSPKYAEKVNVYQSMPNLY